MARRIAVTDFVRHPSADVAILRLDATDDRDINGYPTYAFWDCVSNYGLAEEFVAYGFPDDVNGEGEVESQPRIFVGNFQRFFDYKHASETFRYIAGEMSMGVPLGLSGGPLFRRNAPPMLLAMATANRESYTVSDSFTKVEDNGNTYREETRKVITYGLSLMLDKVKPWLKEELSDSNGRGWVS